MYPFLYPSDLYRQMNYVLYICNGIIVRDVAGQLLAAFEDKNALPSGPGFLPP
jgi:hypothetical protein